MYYRNSSKRLHMFDDYIDKTSISAFNDGIGFIVGYIING